MKIKWSAISQTDIQSFQNLLDQFHHPRNGPEDIITDLLNENKEKKGTSKVSKGPIVFCSITLIGLLGRIIYCLGDVVISVLVSNMTFLLTVLREVDGIIMLFVLLSCFLLAIVLSVIRFTDSDCLFGIFKLF